MPQSLQHRNNNSQLHYIVQAEQESGTGEMTQGLQYSVARCRDSLNECSVGGKKTRTCAYVYMHVCACAYVRQTLSSHLIDIFFSFPHLQRQLPYLISFNLHRFLYHHFHPCLTLHLLPLHHHIPHHPPHPHHPP